MDRSLNDLSVQEFSKFNSTLIVNYNGRIFDQIILYKIPTTTFFNQKQKKNCVSFHLWNYNLINKSLWKILLWPIDKDLMLEIGHIELSHCSILSGNGELLLELPVLINNSKFCIYICTVLTKTDYKKIKKSFFFQNEINVIKLSEN